MSWPRLSEPSRLALKYAALASLWVVFSDSILGFISGGETSSTGANIAKGFVFVAVTGAVLHLLATRMQRRLRERQDALRETNEHLQRVQGMHAALARANQAALTATEENTLCREISEAMVGLAGLRLVWFGWVDENTLEVKPSAQAGTGQSYLENLRCSIAENDPAGGGPVGRAIRQSTSVICADASDTSLEPWANKLRSYGFLSGIAMPLQVGARRGVMCAYAGQPGFFDAETTELVQRLVADLQHGLGLIVDRAERARLDQERRESEARHRALFESNHVAMLLLDPRDGTVADATPAAARILGSPLAELKQRSLRETPLWVDSGLLGAADLAVRHDRPETFRTAIPAPDGGSVQLSATFSPFPFRDDLRLVLCTLEDVTEKHQVTERLRLMQAAIEAAPSGIIIADVLGRIEWVNPAFTAMTGYTLENVVGQSPSILKSGRQGPLFYEQLWNTISRGQTWAGDLQNQHRDGTIYWEHMVIAPVIRANGTIEHYVAIKQDISAQKQMESQVARTQRLESIGLLASGIAHDLNNVLAPILMAMDLFKIRYPEPADQARFDMVRKSAERGAGIVRQVLTFARGVDGERMSLRAEHLVKEVRNLLRETLPRNIEIKLELAPDLPGIVGDPTQLHQVLLNLGVNARDAMPNGGVLTLSVARHTYITARPTRSGLTLPPGEYVSLCVRDTGEGIPPEIMDRVFEPFFTTKPRGAGTGLGLSTVLGIMRGHEGGLDVESTPGAGTCVCVYLPADTILATPPPPPSAHADLVGAGRTILVVDDEEPVRAVTGMALELRGFAHVDAIDGQQALDIFEREPDRFAAVILDQIMPRIGGDELCARLRALRPDLPIVLISGLLPEDKSGRGERPPVCDGIVLQKPFAQVDLFDALARALTKPTPPPVAP